jgi:hypothetical protein
MALQAARCAVLIVLIYLHRKKLGCIDCICDITRGYWTGLLDLVIELA